MECSIWYYFLHGKTHDLYGLIILFILSFILYFSIQNEFLKLIVIFQLIIITGIFVDLWSHCFHH